MSKITIIYRAAFFRGQIEHPGQALLTSVKDDPVYVAINPCGIFIIDLDDSVSNRSAELSNFSLSSNGGLLDVY